MLGHVSVSALKSYQSKVYVTVGKFIASLFLIPRYSSLSFNHLLICFLQQWNIHLSLYRFLALECQMLWYQTLSTKYNEYYPELSLFICRLSTSDIFGCVFTIDTQFQSMHFMLQRLHSNDKYSLCKQNYTINIVIFVPWNIKMIGMYQVFIWVYNELKIEFFGIA